MRKHYESLNYLDGQVGSDVYRFTRTQDADTGYLSTDYYEDEHDEKNERVETPLEREAVEALRDMLNEVLEDWK